MKSTLGEHLQSKLSPQAFVKLTKSLQESTGDRTYQNPHVSKKLQKSFRKAIGDQIS